MIFADGAAGLLLVGLWIFCLIDVITTDESQMRNLPKLAWLFIVLLLPDIGSIAWLVAGRHWAGVAPARGGSPLDRAYPEYDRPGRAVATDPEADEQFLRQVRERAEAQRREYQVRRRQELAAEEEQLRRRRPDEAPD
ncbi:MAG TPA: PLD nuclease N-terminal domain-containing protein [Jatrophihabitans sp.]|uniref:PLD nuclease N-terminal domain-containing protein n=1 Tax=Jatrophihabitans sp. TaxID=1932789 RepID=UPI002DFECCCC|nr:PLD nuclease N-terminal domain-containing protein [Jatrophihabitans sp.]